MTNALHRYAWLSIATALATMALKTVAWWLTGSVGLLSDAFESLVNLAGALMALAMLTIAARPADAGHAHGHGKAEYFSSAFEGLLIFTAALAIAYAAIERLLAPQPLVDLGIGLTVSALAAALNGTVAVVLLRAGRRQRSITLDADGQHLLSDVWTSLGVIVGVTLAAASGWLWLDPAIALLVAVHILHTGWQLLRRSADGLMDASLPDDELARLDAVLQQYRQRGFGIAALRTRQAGRHAFVTLTLLVPGDWRVRQAHALADEVERALGAAVPGLQVTIHVEPQPVADN